MATKLVNIELDQEVNARLAEERMRLRRIAGLEPAQHFQKPMERAFTAEERNKVTILFGGFTWKHEDLIRAVFQGTGYKCEKLPVPDVAAFQIGKEFGNNGQCNPTYFHGRQPGAVPAMAGIARAFRGRRFSTIMSSSPPAHAVRAASACTKPSIASR